MLVALSAAWPEPDQPRFGESRSHLPDDRARGGSRRTSKAHQAFLNLPRSEHPADRGSGCRVRTLRFEFNRAKLHRDQYRVALRPRSAERPPFRPSAILSLPLLLADS
jgi:hypothetical protein